MHLKRLLAIASLAASVATFAPTVGIAQQRSTDIPAEFPPASYQGRQYVDSRGCVYVRAGIDGTVNWVPRVSRSRQQLCGARPTFPGGTGTSAAAARTAGATQITAPEPAPRPRAAAPQPERTVQRAPAPQAQPERRVRQAPAPQPQRVVRSAPAPQPVVRRVPAPQPAATRAPQSKPASAQAPRVVRRVPAAAPQAKRTVPAPRNIVVQKGQPACQGGSAVSNRYINDGSKYPVRCGPQETSPVTVIRRGEAPGPGKNVYYLKPYQDSNAARSLSPQTRILPRHVYENRDDQVVRIPAGYKPAWEDDRLNRHRANQSIRGYRETQAVWTNTVPRRLLGSRQQEVRNPKLVNR